MKHIQQINVYEAAKRRLDFIYKNFKEEEIWLSLSGGKDSTVCFHLMKEVAIANNVKKINVLIIDLEGHYNLHIEHLISLVSDSEIEVKGYWICLPFMLSNASSQYQPKWKCWDLSCRDIWVREYPNVNIVVNESNNCFGKYFWEGMEFEEFIIEFPKFLIEKIGLKKVAQIIGIRTDESYNRFLKLKVRENREFLDNKMWALKQKSTGYATYSIHPIYDWKVSDVWKFSHGKQYNKVYDLMYKIGVPLSSMRICQPFGEEQRDNIDLFSKIEPHTWDRIQNRVSGGNFAKIYKGKNVFKGKIKPPNNVTWELWARIILRSMPLFLKEHYLRRINIFLRWWRKELYKDISSAYTITYQDNELIDSDGLYVVNIPDFHEEDVKKTKPSWRRICKVLIKGDFYCKNLTFQVNKNEYKKLEFLIKKYNNG